MRVPYFRKLPYILLRLLMKSHSNCDPEVTRPRGDTQGLRVSDVFSGFCGVL